MNLITVYIVGAIIDHPYILIYKMFILLEAGT